MLMLMLGALFGQYVTFEARLTPRQERARREAAVARTGEEARPLVEKMGEEAVKTLAVLTPETGRRLAEFHTQGRLEKMARPKEFLIACRSGDDVAAYAIEHAAELQDDSAALAAFCAEPEVYSLRLRPLAEGAAAMRARRLNAAPEPYTPGWRDYALGAAAVIALWLYRRSRRRVYSLSQR